MENKLYGIAIRVGRWYSFLYAWVQIPKTHLTLSLELSTASLVNLGGFVNVGLREGHVGLFLPFLDVGVSLNNFGG